MSSTTEGRSGFLWGIAGTVLFFAAWEVVGALQLAGMTWPPVSRVVASMLEGRGPILFGRALSATLASALTGYAIGALIGLGLAVCAHLLPATRDGLDRLAAVANSIPSIAFAPVFLILLSSKTTPAAVAAMQVFFVVFVAASSGFRASSHAHRDMMTVLGASRAHRFRFLELPAALPSLVSGFRLAVPVAIIGAIIGEWFGSDRGLGVLIVSAMQNFQIDLLWGAALAASLTSLVLYLAMTALERRVYGDYR